MKLTLYFKLLAKNITLLNYFKKISNRLRNNHHLKPKVILDEHELAMAN